MTDVSEDTLPELMRRATDGLEPETTDLVARGMRSGVRLRRRRTAGIVVAAASAMVLTAGAVTFAAQRGGPAGTQAPPVAGQPSASTSAVKKAPPQRTVARPPAETKLLVALRAALPKDLRVSAPKTDGDNLLWNQVSVLVDDGHGAALVEVSVGWKSNDNCRVKDDRTTCRRLADGSPLTTIVAPGGKYDNYVKFNHARLHRKNGSYVMVTSTNTLSMDHGPATRSAPALSIEQLKRIVQDARLAPPPRRPGTIQDTDLDPSLR